MNNKKMIIINSVAGILNQVVILILGMIYRKIFISYLGESLSGLTGLYTDVLSFLNIATAGLGANAIQKIYLYQALKDEEKLAHIEAFINKFYKLAAIIVLTCGGICAFFIDKLIYSNTYDLMFLRTIFLIQVLSECIHYIMYSKRLVLQAVEKSYVSSIIECMGNIAFYILQIICIVIFQSYLLNVVLLLVKRMVLDGTIYFAAKKRVSWLTKKKLSIDRDIIKIFKDLKDTVIMQLSMFLYLSTDNILLSKFLGLVTVNLYGNYMVIIGAANTFLQEINAAIRARIGNQYAIEEYEEERKAILYSNTFLQFILTSLCAVLLFNLMHTFIKLWIGEKFCVEVWVEILLCIKFYVSAMNYPLKNIMNVTGKFKIEKWISISSATVNIVVSILWVKKMGIAGVVAGTVISEILSLLMRSYFYFVKIIKKEFLRYTVLLTGFTFCFTFEFMFISWVCRQIQVENLLLKLIYNFFICIILTVGIDYLIFGKKIREIIKNYRKGDGICY